ncbi:hypothetical protein Bhyg_11546, partial [Pseudolycoriella hygida]
NKAEFLKMNLNIPEELFNDLAYCQNYLRNVIRVHQSLGASLSERNRRDDPRLQELSNEMIDASQEQKTYVDKLRLHMETLFVSLENQNVTIDRASANESIAKQLKARRGDKIEPIHAKRRFSERQLKERYEGMGFELFTRPEEVEVLISPNDLVFANVPPASPSKPQVSLLKPKSERLVPNSPKQLPEEQSPSTSSANLNNRRLNLLQVLNQTKAKNLNLDTDYKNEKKVKNTTAATDPLPKSMNNSPTDDVVLVEPTPTETFVISHSPTSSSATSLSGDTFGGLDLPDEEDEPTQLGKEAFLRVFGLYTHLYYDYIMMRRSERKRRNCTSTEKRDFIYGGKLENVSERPPPKNKRVFLKSRREPRPSTKATKRRKLNSNVPAKKAKADPKSTNTSPSSSLGDEVKMCITCMRSQTDEKCVECEQCNVYFHVSCHESGESITTTHSQRIKNRFCPDCLRSQQKAREKTANQQRVKKIILDQEKLKQRRTALVDQLGTLSDRLTEEHEKYTTLKKEHNNLENVINSLLAPINALTGQELQINDLIA